MSLLNQLRQSINSLDDSEIDEMLSLLVNHKMKGISNIEFTLRKSAPSDGICSNCNFVQPRINKTQFTKCEISPGVYIRAYVIDVPTDCHLYRGFWCYSPEDDRYYTSINNVVICGNPTELRREDELPYKFTEFNDNYKNNVSRDNFYNPPEKFGGKDKRILSEKMKYLPKSNHNKQKYTYRIGDVRNLRNDLMLSTNSEMRLVKDIGAHWMMILYLTSKEYVRRSGKI